MLREKRNAAAKRDSIGLTEKHTENQRSPVLKFFLQFILKLRRAFQKDPTDIIFSNPDFEESLLRTVSRVKSGNVKWHSYKDTFN